MSHLQISRSEQLQRSVLRHLILVQHQARAHLCLQCARLARQPRHLDAHLGLMQERPRHIEAGLEFRHYRCSDCGQGWSQRYDPLLREAMWTMKSPTVAHNSERSDAIVA
ncbi:MAG TPA: hypothetical protein VLC08_10565 [Chitinolyticbacter sp.]|nr:hypothetical protein [Chitinolyticbacter sp.]